MWHASLAPSEELCVCSRDRKYDHGTQDPDLVSFGEFSCTQQNTVERTVDRSTTTEGA